MPTYDYVCRKCEHSFELFQSMSAPVKRKCPKCGEKSLERLIGTGAGIIFKGSGFYETDYRSDSYKKAAEAESKKLNGKKESTTTKTSESKKISETSTTNQNKNSSKSNSKEKTKNNNS